MSAALTVILSFCCVLWSCSRCPVDDTTNGWRSGAYHVPLSTLFVVSPQERKSPSLFVNLLSVTRGAFYYYTYGALPVSLARVPIYVRRKFEQRLSVVSWLLYFHYALNTSEENLTSSNLVKEQNAGILLFGMRRWNKDGGRLSKSRRAVTTKS